MTPRGEIVVGMLAVIAWLCCAPLAAQAQASASVAISSFSTREDSTFGVIATDRVNLYMSSYGAILQEAIDTKDFRTLAGKESVSGSIDGGGTSARFGGDPVVGIGGIATDGTNLYVADQDNNTIRKVVIANRKGHHAGGRGRAAGMHGWRGHRRALQPSTGNHDCRDRPLRG